MRKYFNSAPIKLLNLLPLLFLLVLPQAIASQIKKVIQESQKDTLKVPRIEDGECPLTIPANEKAECRYLVVYEDRRTNQGTTIKLPFIVMKSDSPTPLPDPILYTSGGPGSSSLGQVRNRRYNPFLANRDYIIFEQRGTKYAKPSLQCPEVNDATLTAAKENFSKSKTSESILSSVRACRKRLEKDGINLSAYNSPASADDIEDLRRLLGYEKWNLYGVSYSTRLMLTVLRYHPDGIRSVVLDSVLPPSVNYDETSVDGVVNSLKLIFAACQSDAECRTKYPDLEKRFYTLVKSLDEKPVKVSVKDSNTNTNIDLQIGGSDLVNGIYDALETGYRLPSIPALIAGVEHSDNKALTAIAESKLNVSSFAWGMRYSVWCSEEMPFQNQGLIKNQITTAYPNLKGFGIQTDFPSICRNWKVKSVSKIENEPVSSNIPTLILAGQYDPDTPPAWGKLAAKTLPRSQFFEIPAMSHVPTFGSSCAQELAVSFFNNPLKSVDSRCIEKIKPIKFE